MALYKFFIIIIIIIKKLNLKMSLNSFFKSKQYNQNTVIKLHTKLFLHLLVS